MPSVGANLPDDQRLRPNPDVPNGREPCLYSQMPDSPSQAATFDWVLTLLACALILLGIITSLF
jgi:hypothetical protein